MHPSHKIDAIAENPNGQHLIVECVRNITYEGTVIDGDTDPSDVGGRESGSVTIETENGERIRLIYRDDGSHTSTPVSLYVEKESGVTYELDTIEET